MNRLQKKCVVATAGFHLLLLGILFFGSAFFVARDKVDDTPVLDMIPPDLIDGPSTGVRSPQPPPPPPVVSPPQPTPAPPAPAPVPVVPPTPARLDPTPDKVEPVKPVKPVVKPDLTPVDKPSATKPQPPKINLTLTSRTVPTTRSTSTATATPDNSRAVNSTLRALRNNLSSPTEISPVGNSSAAAANYAQVVKSIYEQAWTPPDDTASDDANIKVRVTIARDGTVLSARVIAPSGDTGVDRSVRSTLERVQFIAPFPSGTTDRERTYIINFNLKAKRMLG